MTKQECAIVETYTGKCMCAGNDRKYAYQYAEKLMGRPVYTHELGEIADELKERSKCDFIRLCKESVDASESSGGAYDTKWISVHDEMPAEDETVLVTYTIDNKKRRYVGTGWCIGNHIGIDGTEYFTRHVDIDVIAWQPMPKAYKGD